MALYSVRSERLFCEQLDYNLLFRWFLDIDNWRRASTRRRSPESRKPAEATSPASSSIASSSRVSAAPPAGRAAIGTSDPGQRRLDRGPRLAASLARPEPRRALRRGTGPRPQKLVRSALRPGVMRRLPQFLMRPVVGQGRPTCERM